jgi:ATP-dependent helicase/DNAse subunit B
MNKEQFDFLKNYYELLKNKNAHNIGDRFITQVKQLSALGEIDKQVATIIAACIALGQEMEGDLTDEDFELLKSLINIGIEMKEERDANKVAQKLFDKVPTKKSSSTTSTDPCGGGYSGRGRGGC